MDLVCFGRFYDITAHIDHLVPRIGDIKGRRYLSVGKDKQLCCHSEGLMERMFADFVNLVFIIVFISSWQGGHVL